MLTHELLNKRKGSALEQEGRWKKSCDITNETSGCMRRVGKGTRNRHTKVVASTDKSSEMESIPDSVLANNPILLEAWTEY